MPLEPEHHNQVLFDLCKKVVEFCGFVLVDISWGQSRSLQVTVYRNNYRIGTDDLEKISAKIGETLDAQATPLIEGRYLLEVQSPGIDRRLKNVREFQIFAGHSVEVKLRQPHIQLGDTFCAQLNSGNESSVSFSHSHKSISSHTAKKGSKSQRQTCETELPEITMPLSAILYIRLNPEITTEYNTTEYREALP